MSETEIVPGPTRPEEITARVVASFDGCEDPRLREIAQSFVRHLHAFVADVGLTEQEWADGIRILTDTGHITGERRQEFILWSDSLGVSMLVDALANPKPAGATESTVLGPFYVPGSPHREYGESIMEPEARFRRGCTGAFSTSTVPRSRSVDRRVGGCRERLYAVRIPRPAIPSPRRLHEGRRELCVPDGAADPVPHPPRRPGRADARGDRQASLRPAHVT
jgi:hypothetical protein